MIILLSPAKTLDFDSPIPTLNHTQPELLDHAAPLVKKLRTLSAGKLATLMSISDALAKTNLERYRSWSLPFTTDTARPAIYAFRGDVYRGFDVDDLAKRDLTFAQKHVRILSGLYGVLRPLDLIQPYRLEMGTALAVARKKNLYEFWGTTITEAVNGALRDSKSRVVVNLASKEYFKSVDVDVLDRPVVTPVFKENRNGTLKIISFSAKKARGLMARYIVQNRIKRPEDMQGFDLERYRYHPDGSTPDEPLFTRDG